jgi:hypothetical protein
MRKHLMDNHMTESIKDDLPLYTVSNEILINFFDKGKSGNYTSHIIEDNNSGEEYVITMQKINGETPLLQLEEAKRQNVLMKEFLEKEVLSSLMGLCQDNPDCPGFVENLNKYESLMAEVKQ